MSTIAHPSPRGDKLCLETEAFVAFRRSFRPLAGISCVQIKLGAYSDVAGFRPLAGISCVADAEIIKGELRAFPSPRGDKLCRPCPWPPPCFARFPSPRGDKLCPGIWMNRAIASFRPLAGISCVCKTAQLGPVGFGPGSDRITISHSTAAGKWQLEIKIPLIFLREPLQTAMQVAAMETRFAQSADSH